MEGWEGCTKEKIAWIWKEKNLISTTAHGSVCKSGVILLKVIKMAERENLALYH